MAIDYNPNFQSYPQGYLPPSEADVRYQYAKALLGQGMSEEPIINPLQGVARMLDTWAGKNLLGQAGQREMLSRNTDARTIPQDPWAAAPHLPPGMIGMPTTPPSPPQISGSTLAQPPPLPLNPASGITQPPRQPGVPYLNNPYMTALMTQPPGTAT